jgi:hypothetical protein
MIPKFFAAFLISLITVFSLSAQSVDRVTAFKFRSDF